MHATPEPAAVVTAPPLVFSDQDARIFVSAKEAATILGLSRAQTYELLNEGLIETRYFGRRRLVVLDSLREFADSLPTTRAS